MSIQYEMKKILPLLFSLLTFAAFAQEVPEVQKSLITKTTATWCGNCGTWGWTFYEDLISDNDNNAVMVAAHGSGDLVSDAGVWWNSNLNASGQPRFYVGNEYFPVNSGSTSSVRTAIKNAVDAQIAQAPLAGVGIEAIQSGNQITINTRAKFFQNTNGSFYTAIYVIEENVIANQSGQGSNTSHHDILRVAVTPEEYGDDIATGDVFPDGVEYPVSYTIDIDASWDVNNLIFAAVIWKAGDNGKYDFINTNSTSEVMFVSSNNQLAEDFAVRVGPNPALDFVNVSLDLSQGGDVEMQLVDLAGKTLLQRNEGSLSQGHYNFRIDRETIPSGIYLLRTSVDGVTSTKKVVFR